MKTKTNSSLCVFILTHGRPDNIKTIKTLKNCGYTGPVFLVIDNEDKTTNKYIENFGVESVKIFDKKYYADNVDEGNNFDERRTITHARNACFDIAEELGFKYFIELDDDYTSFDFRIDTKSTENRGDIKPIKDINNIFNSLLLFYKNTPFKSIAFSQGGDFIGGINNGKGSYRFNKRKCMNSFLCSIEKKFSFIGAMNEDVNTYTSKGSRGELFYTVPLVSLTQTATQSNNSGITDMYLLYGTYCKAFTSVMMAPSSIRVSMMNSSSPRIHHKIKWANTVPCIVPEKFKLK